MSNTIDPGITNVTELVEALGFDIIDSGDGHSRPEVIEAGGAMPYPHILVRSSAETCMGDLDRLCAGLRARGIKLGPTSEEVGDVAMMLDEEGQHAIDGDGAMVQGEFHEGGHFYLELTGLDDELLKRVDEREAARGR